MFEILKGFLPWILYFVFSDPEHAMLGALLALVVHLFLGLHGLRKRRILDWVTLLYFAALAVAFAVGDAEALGRYAFIMSGVTLSFTALGSVAAGIPFTLQYARESVPEEYQDSPLFFKVNRILSLVWGGAFVLQTLLSVLYLEHIGSASLMNEILPNAITLTTVFFTARFPEWYTTRELSRGGVAALSGISPLQVVSFSDGRAAYRFFGQGDPLVMLNGSHMTLHNWDPDLLEGLSRVRTLYLFDYPGIGESSYPVPENVGMLCDWLEEALQGLGLEKFALLGYSMGGWLAQEYACRHPERVERLVLLGTDPGGSRAQPGREEDLKALSDESGTEQERGMRMMSVMFPEDAIEPVVPKLQRIFQSASLQPQVESEVVRWEDGLAEEWFSGEQSNRLSVLPFPVLIGAGERDIIVPFANALLIQEALPQSKLLRYPRAGHGLIYQETEALLKEVVGFLSAAPGV